MYIILCVYWHLNLRCVCTYVACLVPLLFVVSTFSVNVFPSDQQGIMIGSSQAIECTTQIQFKGVEANSVRFNWIGPNGISITNDDRVNISPTSSSNNTFTSTLQFSYLMKGDEGIYRCNVTILRTTVQGNTEIQTLTG